VHKLFTSLILSTALLVAAWTAPKAEATPVGGSFSMAGAWIPIGGTGSIATATGLDFIPNPGVATGQFAVTTPGGTGAFSSLAAGMLGTVKDLVFAPFTAPLASFITIGGFTLDLLNLTVDLQNSHFLVLDGVAEISGPGLAAQQATFLLASQGVGSPMTFGWSGSVGFETANNGDGDPPGKGNGNPPPTNIPEPMSLALLGIGLAGYGATRRRET
jgi:hypothetical protein